MPRNGRRRASCQRAGIPVIMLARIHAGEISQMAVRLVGIPNTLSRTDIARPQEDAPGRRHVRCERLSR